MPPQPVPENSGMPMLDPLSTACKPKLAAGNRETRSESHSAGSELACRRLLRRARSCESGGRRVVLLRGLVIDKVDKGAEDGSSPQTVGTEIFVCGSERREQR